MVLAQCGVGYIRYNGMVSQELCGGILPSEHHASRWFRNGSET